MTVLVAGASGTTGAEVARRLRDAGVDVRTASRREGFDVRADLADPASLRDAVDGVDAVYVATSASPALPELEGNLAEAAAAAGVGHLVKLSVIGADPASPLTFARLHHAAEQRITATGIPATFVRPNGFMQNTLAVAGQLAGGVVRVPAADARWSIVDVRDVAGVAVSALRDPGGHRGRAWTVTGPEASSPREQVAVLAELLGRPLEVVDLGIPEEPRPLRELYELYARGDAQAVSLDAERVLGRPPRSFRDFAADHRDAFSA